MQTVVVTDVTRPLSIPEKSTTDPRAAEGNGSPTRTPQLIPDDPAPDPDPSNAQLVGVSRPEPVPNYTATVPRRRAPDRRGEGDSRSGAMPLGHAGCSLDSSQYMMTEERRRRMEAFGSKKSVKFDIEDGEELEAHLAGEIT